MAAKFETVEQQWQEFAAAVFGGGSVGRTQYEEMRKAFYAGCWSMLCQAVKISTETATEDEGAEQFEKLKVELERFNKQLQRKAARGGN